jgi:class 3 adenylate cyclase
MWNQVLNKVRAPLHKIISYGELVSEDPACKTDPKVDGTVSRMLNVCEGLLQQTQAQFCLPLEESADAVTRFTSQMIQYQDSITNIASELELYSKEHLPESIQRDMRTIISAIRALDDALKTLSASSASEASATHSADKAEPSPRALSEKEQSIAPIEYLGLLLVVDDDEGNRDVLSRRLLRSGYEVMLAEGGRQALRMLSRYEFDLVLLDIMMPDIDGIGVLTELKQDPKLNQLPVIMITAVDEIETIVLCIEAGADDYLLKPFNPVLLRARIRALLERKRLQDAQRQQRRELELILEDNRRQAERAERMLLNILPPIVADELRENGFVRPMYFEDVTIVFADIVGFTLSTEQLPADELVELLHQYFTECDKIVDRYGLEKLKTIGDCYMFAGGLPRRKPSHPVDSVLAAIEMIAAMAELSKQGRVSWQLRVGINTGPVIAGVVGIHKFAFDIWGDSVNFAKRVESCGAPGRINLSVSTYARVKDFVCCEKREKVRVKEGKDVEMYFVDGVATSLLNKPAKTILDAFRTRYATFFRTDLVAFPLSVFEPRSKASVMVVADLNQEREHALGE